MDESNHASRTQALYGYESTADHGAEATSHPYGSRGLLPLDRHILLDDSAAESRLASMHHGGGHLTSLAPYIAPPPKTSVPIAEVLNDGGDLTSPFGRPGVIAEQHLRHSAAPPTFSGRLSDILIDRTKVLPSHLPHQYKRRKVDDVLEANTPTNAMSSATSSLTPGHTLLGTLENNSLTLPKPTTRPVKSTTRRQRIPPLLQGLHQPPPLPPEGRLFPPITGEGGSFGAGIGTGEGLGFRRAPGKSIDHRRSKAQETSLTAVPKEKTRPEHLPAEERDPASTQVQGTEGTEAAKESPDAEGRVTTEAKETKKRNKWTADETKDLLTGVGQFGVGKWKKILDCEDFHFNNRTAADLKDRFRTCCPEGGLKATRKSRAKAARTDKVAPHSISPPAGSHRTPGDISSGGVSRSEPVRARKPREGTDRISAAELEQMGIHGPFLRAERRKHRQFTAEDDENLLKGFKKWNGKWHLIRDDEELGFSERHSTDLRDRFRVRYPERYAEAGKKLKEREKLLLDKKAKGSGASTKDTHKSDDSSNKVVPEPDGSSERETSKATSKRRHSQELEPQPRPYLQPDSFPGPLDDLEDIFSESDAQVTHSPITLSRTILDSNPTNNGAAVAAALPSSRPPITHRADPVIDDTATSWLQSSDDQHVDPRALNLVMLRSSHNPAMANTAPALISTSLSARLQRTQTYSLGGDMSRQVDAPPQSRQSIPLNSSIDSLPNSRFSALDACSARNMASANSLQRQRRLRHEQSLSSHPNLPTLVVPPVPSSSARNATHNLPRPADLLSMVDEDTLIREERPASTSIPQSSNDDNFIGLNLAPTNRINTFGMEWQGQGMEPASVPLLLASGTAVPTFQSANLRPFYHPQGTAAGGGSIGGNGSRREGHAGHREANNPG